MLALCSLYQSSFLYTCNILLGRRKYKQQPPFGAKICQDICPRTLHCSEKRTVFRERSSRKTVSFEEQIMSKDKYPSIFSKSNGGYCVYYPNIFRNTRSFENWGIFNNYSPKWRWLAVDIYRAAKRRGKHPTLATDSEVNSCFSIY